MLSPLATGPTGILVGLGIAWLIIMISSMASAQDAGRAGITAAVSASTITALSDADVH